MVKGLEARKGGNMGSKNRDSVNQTYIRLFIDHPITTDSELPLSNSQSHYLMRVMRYSPGAEILIFNGLDGEWLATILEKVKKTFFVLPKEQIQEQHCNNGPILLFSLIKNDRVGFLIEKACEMGVSELYPVWTEYSQRREISIERVYRRAIEAAEQSGRLTVPRLHNVMPLATLLKSWPSNRNLLFCDENCNVPVKDALEGDKKGSWAILIGPEGGFSVEERHTIQSHPYTAPVSLGTRILRSETAALSAITIANYHLNLS